MTLQRSNLYEFFEKQIVEDGKNFRQKLLEEYGID